jgi:predicted RND superfamily exporter protein
MPAGAMLEAGRIRLRPILMTAMATIMGILPVALGPGRGRDGARPLGIAVVAGMITSTFLTLLVVPVVYILVSKLRRGGVERGDALGTAYAVLPFLGPGAIQFIGRVDDFIFGWVGTKDEVWGELLLLEVIPRPHLLAARN